VIKKDYQVTRIFKHDEKAQAAFWARYFTMAVKTLSDFQGKKSAKVVSYEKSDSLSTAQH